MQDHYTLENVNIEELIQDKEAVGAGLGQTITVEAVEEAIGASGDIDLDNPTPTELEIPDELDLTIIDVELMNPDFTMDIEIELPEPPKSKPTHTLLGAMLPSTERRYKALMEETLWKPLTEQDKAATVLYREDKDNLPLLERMGYPKELLELMSEYSYIVPKVRVIPTLESINLFKAVIDPISPVYFEHRPSNVELGEACKSHYRGFMLMRGYEGRRDVRDWLEAVHTLLTLKAEAVKERLTDEEQSRKALIALETIRSLSEAFEELSSAEVTEHTSKSVIGVYKLSESLYAPLKIANREEFLQEDLADCQSPYYKLDWCLAQLHVRASMLGNGTESLRTKHAVGILLSHLGEHSNGTAMEIASDAILTASQAGQYGLLAKGWSVWLDYGMSVINLLEEKETTENWEKEDLLDAAVVKFTKQQTKMVKAITALTGE